MSRPLGNMYSPDSSAEAMHFESLAKGSNLLGGRVLDSVVDKLG
jgi:hypothetical protein